MRKKCLCIQFKLTSPFSSLISSQQIGLRTLAKQHSTWNFWWDALFSFEIEEKEILPLHWTTSLDPIVGRDLLGLQIVSWNVWQWTHLLLVELELSNVGPQFVGLSNLLRRKVMYKFFNWESRNSILVGGRTRCLQSNSEYISLAKSEGCNTNVSACTTMYLT